MLLFLNFLPLSILSYTITKYKSVVFPSSVSLVSHFIISSLYFFLNFMLSLHAEVCRPELNVIFQLTGYDDWCETQHYFLAVWLNIPTSCLLLQFLLQSLNNLWEHQVLTDQVAPSNVYSYLSWGLPVSPDFHLPTMTYSNHWANHSPGTAVPLWMSLPVTTDFFSTLHFENGPTFSTQTHLIETRRWSWRTERYC